MNTVDIDGITYELIAVQNADEVGTTRVLLYRPLSAKKETLIEILAKAAKLSVDSYREYYQTTSAAFDAIEARLRALEEEVK